MKKIFIPIALFVIFLTGCSSSDPVSPVGVLQGSWKLNYYGSSNDTLLVTLEINSSNYVLEGSGHYKFLQHQGGTFREAESTSSLHGSYTDSSLTVSFSDFSFSGIKSNSDYTGTAVYVKSFPSDTDTLFINNATFIKQ
jgi:hypothetical protein